MDEEEQQLLDAFDEGAERLPGEPRLDALVLNHARERVEVLKIALRAAEQGVFLSDGYKDSPNDAREKSEGWCRHSNADHPYGGIGTTYRAPCISPIAPAFSHRETAGNFQLQ